MSVLFLTNNPNMASTSRILQYWLPIRQRDGQRDLVAVRDRGDFTDWLSEHAVAHVVNPMPHPDKRWPWPSLWEAAKLARAARRSGVELIHCNEHDVYPFAALLKRLLRLPVVCHARFRVSREFAGWAMRGGRRPDALLWTSHTQKNDCTDAVAEVAPPERQHVVPLGVDLSSFGGGRDQRAEVRRAWGLTETDLAIGTACALRPIKRVHEFIELITHLARRDRRVVGLIAGGPVPGHEDYRDQLASLVTRSGLGGRLRLLGNLEPIEPFLHGLDVFVSSSEYETFGYSVCEAMACGLPVAAYEGGSVAEVLGDAGAVVPTGDVAALICEVAAMLNEPDYRRELGESARRRVAEHFDPTHSYKTLCAIYRGLGARRAA